MILKSREWPRPHLPTPMPVIRITNLKRAHMTLLHKSANKSASYCQTQLKMLSYDLIKDHCFNFYDVVPDRGFRCGRNFKPVCGAFGDGAHRANRYTNQCILCQRMFDLRNGDVERGLREVDSSNCSKQWFYSLSSLP